MLQKSGAEQILSNLTELIRNSLKMRARVFTQEELDLNISNHRLSYHQTV